MSEPFGTIVEKESFGSPISPQAIRVFKCYEIKTAEVFVTYQKNPFGGTNLVTVGKAKVYCECLWDNPLGYTSINNLYEDWPSENGFPSGKLDFSGITNGSLESGRYTYFQSESKICCEPCATWNITPYEAGEEIQSFDDCLCQNNANPSEVSWRTTGEASPLGVSSDEDSIKADIKKALDQLGDCKCKPLPAGFRLRRGESLA
tara:strand:- start:471 stop:1082 length:612 start_codon:yes stop_codon:yes gene_type:complete